jgi:translation initiation factor eIF-2B subunit beta
MAAEAALTETTSAELNVREWLTPHQLALLDRFLLELRRGRRQSQNVGSSLVHIDRRVITHRTVDLLRNMIGSTKWESPAQLLTLLRGLGKELHAAGGSREPAIGNVVRRLMAAVREESSTATPTSADASGGGGGRLSLESMLWALPQHVKRSNRSLLSKSSSGDHQRQESFADADLEAEFPASYYVPRPDLKSCVMEAGKC